MIECWCDWQLDINERLQKTFVITNSSQYDIDFTWELKSNGRGAVTIGPVSSRLEHGRSEQCLLTFTSERPVILKHCQLILRVSQTHFLFVLKLSVCLRLSHWSSCCHCCCCSLFQPFHFKLCLHVEILGPTFSKLLRKILRSFLMLGKIRKIFGKVLTSNY